MRRAVITASATAAGVVLLLSLKPHDPAAVRAVPAADGTAPAGGTGGVQDTGADSRTLTGSAVNTRYGPVQVVVTMAGTRISRIDVVQYPTRDRRDQEINERAVPVLNQEAIAAQSADIDVVSGATYTSEGYTRSLQSALDQAAQ
ncbi:FMN-binding protein [Kitasatospora phosalacinea]|uniref:FMN-binding protein n=1 Tax=Kitasatospora phosalacinea TaxID=2065 RepID=A0A9W6PM45_9ACTN|nr:FMN-binding protein [Kitasatospora phosalacinea]GLW57383.1 FMN-binding protein [Kitasatospora phosalacinea]